MQNKLRQLVISAVMRNDQINHCPLSLSMKGYTVYLYGEVENVSQVSETVRTIQAVSPMLVVENHVHLRQGRSARV